MSEVMVRVGKKFTIVIPARIRRAIDLKEGDILRVKLEGNKIILEKPPEDPFETLARIIRKPYDEEKEEKRAEEWLLRNASG